MLHQLLFQQGSGDQKCASPLRLSQQLDLLFTQKSWQESIAKENYYLMSEFLSFNGYSLKLLDSINSMRCHTLVKMSIKRWQVTGIFALRWYLQPSV